MHSFQVLRADLSASIYTDKNFKILKNIMDGTFCKYMHWKYWQYMQNVEKCELNWKAQLESWF